MNGRRTLTLALGALGALLIIDDASALTRRTRECVSAARLVRRACSLQCSDDLRGNTINCFGAQGGCPTSCFTDQSACQLPVATARTECTRACNDTLRTVLQGCFQSADPVTCSDAARAQAQACNLLCRNAADPGLRACADGFNDCLESCASPR